MERFQRQFAASDVRAARQSRLDRAYFLYDKQVNRQLHLEGVSLWDGLPKATLPEALTPVCREVLSEIAYQVVADRLARKPNPAPALQEKLGTKPQFDGMLFEDAGFDAQGRLQFDVLLAPVEAQRLEVERLLRDPPLAEGVLPADPARRELRIVLHLFDWPDLLKTVRAWAAGPTAPAEARHTRLDRAYFVRPDGGCELHLVGASLLSAAEGDLPAAAAVRTRIAGVVGQRCLTPLKPFKLKLPAEPKPLAREVILARRDLLGVLRGSIAERPAMDGINLTDVVFDGAGRVALEGHWLGEGQARDLGALLRETLRPEAPALTRDGATLEHLRVVRTDLLLRDLRTRLVEHTAVEEVLFDRLFFGAQGKLRVTGFFTRPPDKEAAEKAGLDGPAGVSDRPGPARARSGGDRETGHAGQGGDPPGAAPQPGRFPAPPGAGRPSPRRPARGPLLLRCRRGLRLEWAGRRGRAVTPLPTVAGCGRERAGVRGPPGSRLAPGPVHRRARPAAAALPWRG